MAKAHMLKMGKVGPDKVTTSKSETGQASGYSNADDKPAPPIKTFAPSDKNPPPPPTIGDYYNTVGDSHETAFGMPPTDTTAGGHGRQHAVPCKKSNVVGGGWNNGMTFDLPPDAE